METGFTLPSEGSIRTNIRATVPPGDEEMGSINHEVIYNGLGSNYDRRLLSPHLFDLEKDPRETINLATEHSDIVQRADAAKVESR